LDEREIIPIAGRMLTAGFRPVKYFKSARIYGSPKLGRVLTHRHEKNVDEP
jgi:hypothetical protein